MWTPKQLLHEKVIDALFQGGFSKLQIQFLGWLSNTSSALNNSRNPVKAAHTLLSKASDPDEKLFRMLETFAQRKRESIEPEIKDQHDHADAVFGTLEDYIDTSIIKAQMRASGYEDFSKGGVSDGEDSITSTRPENEEEIVVTGEEHEEA